MRQDPRTADATAPVRRLRRRLFGGSVAVMLAVASVVSTWLLVGGASVSDLRLPLAGMILALSAELLCLDVAIRRVQRLMEPASPCVSPVRPRALGV